jgi:hypothetical protein
VSSAPEAARGSTRVRHVRKRKAGRRFLAGGVVWIVTIAVLLAGVVALNVAVLRLNLGLDGANRQRNQLRADIAADQAKLASAKRTGNIVQGATGFVPADASATTVIDLPH